MPNFAGDKNNLLVYCSTNITINSIIVLVQKIGGLHTKAPVV